MSEFRGYLHKPTEDFLEKIKNISSLKELKPEKINEFASNLAKDLIKEIREDITTTQLRKVYGEIKRLQREETFDEKKLYILDPRLAYATAREKKLNDIYAIFKECLPKIKEKPDLNMFTYILEAIVAYHKYEKALKGKEGE
ncbi:MAG: type III-A CRISPR-associated protein Csm2 [archaeon]|nr:type III-A CRISPR-associated protein Csm2 [archaeon]MCP8314839.1 type III-A CRISPR-associated protein Csm2 [archaeon]